MNAMEVVNAYPNFEALKKFKEWIASPDEKLLEEVEARAAGKNMSRKKDKKRAEEDLPELENGNPKDPLLYQKIFEEKHVNFSLYLPIFYIFFHT